MVFDEMVINDLQNTRKQKIEQQQKHGVNSGFLKRKAVPAPLMAPTVVSIRLDSWRD
jgi:hypothetical protein